MTDKIWYLIESCWHRDPALRPTMDEAYSQLIEISQFGPSITPELGIASTLTPPQTPVTPPVNPPLSSHIPIELHLAQLGPTSMKNRPSRLRKIFKRILCQHYRMSVEHSAVTELTSADSPPLAPADSLTVRMNSPPFTAVLLSPSAGQPFTSANSLLLAPGEGPPLPSSADPPPFALADQSLPSPTDLPITSAGPPLVLAGPSTLPSMSLRPLAPAINPLDSSTGTTTCSDGDNVHALLKKAKKYQDNRELVLEILQTAVAVVGSVDGLLPVGGAIISKVLQSIQVKS
jgi:hypothetical protein